MAQTTAGISFWVDLRKGRLSRYTIQKRVKKAIALLFRYIILISLGFVILTPLLKLAKDALTDPSALASKSSVWIPQKVSTIFFEMSMTKAVLNYWPSLCYTLATTTVLTFFQVLSTGLAAYSFARLNKGKMKIVSKILFAMVRNIYILKYLSENCKYSSLPSPNALMICLGNIWNAANATTDRADAAASARR